METFFLKKVSILRGEKIFSGEVLENGEIMEGTLKLKLAIYFLILFSVSFFVGYGHHMYLYKGHIRREVAISPTPTNLLQGEKGRGKVTPVVSPSPSVVRKVDYIGLKKLIKRDLASFTGEYGIFFYDFATSKSIGIRADDIFEAASMIKVPIMVGVYRKIDEGKFSPKMEVELKESYKVGGSGILKNKPSGSKWSVEKLVELMICDSDNTATDMLIDLVGMKFVEEISRSFGAKHTTLRRKIYDFAAIDRGKDNLTTPHDMGLIFKGIYQKARKGDKSYKKMLSFLKGVKNKKIIPRYLPLDVVCAHKTGELLGVVNDGGIVFPKNRPPYIIVFMSKRVYDSGKAKEMFAKTSKDVYQYLEGK